MFSCIATLYITLPTSPPYQPYLINIATLFKLQGVSEKRVNLVFCNFMASKGTRKVFFNSPAHADSKNYKTFILELILADLWRKTDEAVENENPNF